MVRTPGPRGTPSSRLFHDESVSCGHREAGGGPAADEGVRPTIHADIEFGKTK